MNIIKRWGIYLLILVITALATAGIGYFYGYRNGYDKAVFRTLDNI